MKVLMIDEDPFIIDLYSRVLTQEQMDFKVAHDTSEAQIMLQGNVVQPDIIILEPKMADTDGLEFLKTIKADPKLSRIPVLILSNLYSREDQQKGLEAGAAEYLIKSQHDPQEVLSHILAIANK